VISCTIFLFLSKNHHNSQKI